MSNQFQLGLVALKKCAKKIIFEKKYPVSESVETGHVSVSQVDNTNTNSVISQTYSQGSFVGYHQSIVQSERIQLEMLGR